MKKLLSLALTAMLALPLAAFGQGSLKIGTINMDRAFKEYTKTKEAEKKINDAKDAAKKVFDESGMSFNGVPLVMYSRDSYDFTNDVVAALNKPGRTSTLNSEMPPPTP